MFLSYSPPGIFQILNLSAAPDAKEYSSGCIASALTPFLCAVRVLRHFPVRISQNFIVLSAEPVMI